MIDLRFHGRAGQGIVTAAELLATAASMEGMHSQAFPVFGSEKRGPPITSYCRIRKKPFLIHEEITEPNIVVVVEPSIIGYARVKKGLKRNGVLILNTKKSKKELNLRVKNVFTVDGTKIALKYLKKPITNTVMLGALVKVTGIVKIESIKKALRAKFANKFSQETINENILVIQECFNKMELKKEDLKKINLN